MCRGNQHHHSNQCAMIQNQLKNLDLPRSTYSHQRPLRVFLAYPGFLEPLNAMEDAKS